MKFAIVHDYDSDIKPCTIQLISYKETNNNKTIIVEKSYLFKPLQYGEIGFESGAILPKALIDTIDLREIIKTLFEKF